ncbi:DUF1430 domain-containing protein, partial [bacterium]|nr:DUF1430 domain-containing protein [bacterium]
NIYRKYNQLSLIDASTYDVNFIYTKNNQKFFSYDEKINKNTFNYIYDPIIYVCNGENQSTDFYVSVFSAGEVYVAEDLKKVILENDSTKKYIVGFSNTYNRITDLVLHLNKEFDIACISLIFIALIYILLIITTSLYYLEMNKQKFVIMKIHGYSIWNMTHRYICLNILISIALITMYLLLQNVLSFYLIILFIIMLTLELLILYSTLKLQYKMNPIKIKE